MVLEGLDAIDWDNIYHLQGRATQVPILLQKMVDALNDENDPDAWLDVNDELYDLIDPDDKFVITEVTSYLIPFWVQFLTMNSLWDYRYAFLGHIGWSLARYKIGEQYGEEHRKEFEARGMDYDKQIALGSVYQEKVYKTALEYFPVYVNCLQDEVPGVRGEALFVLRKFKEKAPTSVPLILDCYASEPSLSVKDEMMLSLRQLIVNNDVFSAEQRRNHMPFFEAVVKSEGYRAAGRHAEPTAGFQAALALIDELGSEANSIAIELLVRCAINCGKTERGDYNMEAACDALSKVGVEKGMPALVRVLDNTKAHPKYVIASAVHNLLQTAFGKPACTIYWGHLVGETFLHYSCYEGVGNPPSAITKLTTYQKLALESIINRRKVWKWRTNLFEWYGLPNARKELKALLKKLPVSEEG
jgi:hypothetical protein